jgi:hypothetical protein
VALKNNTGVSGFILGGFALFIANPHLISFRKAGSRYFCESLFWASQPKQAAKT